MGNLYFWSVGESHRTSYSMMSTAWNELQTPVASAVLINQGQVCAAHSRLIVHESVADELLRLVVSRYRFLSGATPRRIDYVRATSKPAQRDRVKRFVEQGVTSGAQAVLLGRIQTSGGCYVSPTIFDRVDTNMEIWREEIFGPVLCLHRFNREDDAIKLANNTVYGLGATVWTRDLGRGRRVAHALRVGGVFVRTSGAQGPEAGSLLALEPRKHRALVQNEAFKVSVVFYAKAITSAACRQPRSPPAMKKKRLSCATSPFALLQRHYQSRVRMAVAIAKRL